MQFTRIYSFIENQMIYHIRAKAWHQPVAGTTETPLINTKKLHAFVS